MAKTKRHLLRAIADKIGGERGRRMRDAAQNLPYLDVLDRPLSDHEYAAMLEQAERDLPTALASFENLGPECASWGFSN